MDNVNHPSHYESSCSIECIDAMRAVYGDETVIIFCKLNAFKYLWRHKNKNGLEDLQKAKWYLNEARTLDRFSGYTTQYDDMENIVDLYINKLNKEDYIHD